MYLTVSTFLYIAKRMTSNVEQVEHSGLTTVPWEIEWTSKTVNIPNWRPGG